MNSRESDQFDLMDANELRSELRNEIAASFGRLHVIDEQKRKIATLQRELAEAKRGGNVGAGLAVEIASLNTDLEAEVSTLRESLAEVNRLLSLNVAEVARLQSWQESARQLLTECSEWLDAVGDLTTLGKTRLAELQAKVATLASQTAQNTIQRLSDMTAQYEQADQANKSLTAGWAELQAQVLALRSCEVDAKRYRHIREHRPDNWKWMPADTLDSAIDAAIAAQPASPMDVEKGSTLDKG